MTQLKEKLQEALERDVHKEDPQTEALQYAVLSERIAKEFQTFSDHLQDISAITNRERLNFVELLQAMKQGPGFKFCKEIFSSYSVNKLNALLGGE